MISQTRPRVVRS